LNQSGYPKQYCDASVQVSDSLLDNMEKTAMCQIYLLSFQI